MSATAPIEKPIGGRAKITNNFHLPHREQFRGQWIEIPAHGSIEMEYFDAVSFIGQVYPFHKNEAGQVLKCKALTMKKLDEVDGDWKPTQFISHLDGKVFATEDELKAHLKEAGENYIPVKDERLDAQVARKQQSENLSEMMSVLKNISQVVGALDERLTKLEAPKGRKRDTKRDNNSSEAVGK